MGEPFAFPFVLGVILVMGMNFVRVWGYGASLGGTYATLPSQVYLYVLSPPLYLPPRAPTDVTVNGIGGTGVDAEAFVAQDGEAVAAGVQVASLRPASRAGPFC